MNKRFLISVIVAFLMFMAFGFLVHGLLLEAEYSTVPNIYRTQEDARQYMVIMPLANALAAVAFVWIYQRGKENKPYLGQGLRFGLAVAALLVIPKFLIYYAIQPMPGILAVKQIIFDTIAIVLIAVVVARLNK